ncbi:site-specific DNA-methyltransferase [Microbacteriaceae bacterium 4G12]
MDKLNMHASDLTKRNLNHLAELFPSVITETRDESGNVVRAIDFDLLRQELSDHVVEGPQERYHLDWPGKREAALLANVPIAKTLRPVRGESVDFDTTKNLFIEGDNLESLKLLQESYLGKVKLIYIDPPYNTGNDFIYDDDFAESAVDYAQRTGERDAQGQQLVANSEANGRFHSDWLSMMYPRLKLARNLLRTDGAIFISIDDHEVDNLRKLCDEVFGAQNFVAQIIWQKVFAPKNSARWFSEDHDYVLVYSRNAEEWTPNLLPQTEEMLARYKNPDNDPRGRWTSSDVAARNRYDAGLYPITTPSGRVIDGPPRGRYWGISEEKFKEYDADGRIWWGADGANVPRLKRFLSEVRAGKTPQTLWTYQEVGHTQDAKKTLLKYVPFEHTENVLNSVKPVALIQRILHLATEQGAEDIVLDFFSGSGTTAHAVLKQNEEDGGNRRFIAIQVHEPLRTRESTFDSILGMSTTRIRNVAAEFRQQGNGGEGDLGFRQVRVDTTNMADVLRSPDALSQNQLDIYRDSVKPDRTGEDLLFQVLLDGGLEPTMEIAVECIDGHEVFVVEDGALIGCFEQGISASLVRQIAAYEPVRAVFLDSAFATDAERINVQQIFTEMSPATTVKAI